MTVSNTNVKANYTGNGVTDTFAITFDYRVASEVKVYEDDVLQVDGVDYNIVGANVVFVAAPADEADVLIKRVSAKTQPDDLINGGAFPGVAIEERFDKVIHLIQEANDDLTTGIGLSPSSALSDINLPVEEAGKYIGWNAAATALENKADGIAAWANGVVYAIDDIVKRNSNLYFCLANHTAADFDTDLLSGRWTAGLGIRGPAGNNGGDGAQGAQGPQGVQGIQGATGAAGANGVFSEIAAEGDATGGVENTKGMTALRTKQAIDEFVGTAPAFEDLEERVDNHDTDIAGIRQDIANIEAVMPTQPFSSGGYPLNNNAAAAVDIDGPDGNANASGYPLLLDSDDSEQYEIIGQVYRSTDDSTRVSQVVLLAQYVLGTWYIGVKSVTILAGDPDGVTFGLNAVAADRAYVTYTTDNMAGANYTGRFRWIIRRVPISL